jgi:hypothetical protein
VALSEPFPFGADGDLTGPEYVAERADYYRTARKLISEHEWPGSYDPADVLELAAYLSGDHNS